MADLLSNSEIGEVFAALRDVTDTFNKNTIVYHKITSNYDQWAENNPKVVTDVNLLCRITIEEDSDADSKADETGQSDERDILASFNFEYLQGLTPTLTNTNEALFKKELEYMSWNGANYKIIDSHSGDTEFAGKPVLWIVKLERVKKQP